MVEATLAAYIHGSLLKPSLQLFELFDFENVRENMCHQLFMYTFDNDR